jgi:hypothetical protein
MAAPTYHSAASLASRFAFSAKHIRQLVRAGAFGPDYLMVGSDLRVPESGVSFFISQHRVRVHPGASASRGAVFSRPFAGSEGVAA